MRGTAKGGCALVAAMWVVSVGPVFASDGTSDAWITARTKIALLTTEPIGRDDINVDTVDGRVTLHGVVTSHGESVRAADEAHTVEGVQSVRNLLRLVPRRHAPGVAASDSELKVGVAEALRRDRSLEDSHIIVEVVDDGVVRLGGNAASVGDHLRAIQAARTVPGLQRVETEVRDPDGLAGEELRRDGGAPAGATKDMWITTDTKARLFADSRTPALDINVDTRDGVVTLFGSVSTQNARVAAAADAHEVRGVTRVVNDIEVVPSAKREKVKPRDEGLLTIAVKQALALRDGLADVDVEVKNGKVRFTGTVAHEPARLEAAIVARSTPGVRAVEDDLRIDALARER